ncbi:MAG: ribosome-associated translation inhibitor RaiA [Muribaculaceae bacterium]|nr:ribosome-associated translation inhibitor RaiA [Muribaculaceae bacterium]
MNIRIQAIHFEIADRLTDFINKKANKLARRFPDITDVDVNLRVVKPETAMNKEAILRVILPLSPDLVATKTADTFEEAVDLCLEAVERQLEKNKEKK